MRSASGIKLLCISIAVVLFSPQASAAARRPDRGQPVAIWSLRSLGLDQQLVGRVQRGLSQAFRRNKDWKLASHKALKVRLKKAGLDQRAPVQTLAPALGVGYLVTGTLAGLGDEISLDFKVYEGAKGAEVRRVSISLPAGGEGWPELFDELVVRLLSPDKWAGGLQLDVSEEGALVLLDGAQIATTPLSAPVDGLAPGKHILIIRKEGFGEVSKFVVIRYKQVARLKIDLANATVVGLIYEQNEPPPPKPTPPPEPVLAPPPAVQAAPTPGPNWQQTVGWTCLGLGAAAAVSGGFLAWHASDLERRIEDRIWTAEDGDLLDKRLRDGRTATAWAERLFIGAGSAAALSAAFLIWGALAGPDPDGPEQPAGAGGVSAVVFEGGSGLIWFGRF